MQHTPIQDNMNVSHDEMRIWGNVMMLSSNNFDISAYTNRDVSPSDFEATTDTEMCAITCAAALKIGQPENYTVNDSSHISTEFVKGGWNDFSLTLFSVERINDPSDIGNRIGYWIGSQDWAQTDNTAKGAGQRILYMLDNGVPDWRSIRSMMSGELELCYKDTAKWNDKAEKIDISKLFNIDEMLDNNPELFLEDKPLTYADLIPS